MKIWEENSLQLFFYSIIFHLSLKNLNSVNKSIANSLYIFMIQWNRIIKTWLLNFIPKLLNSKPWWLQCISGNIVIDQLN